MNKLVFLLSKLILIISIFLMPLTYHSTANTQTCKSVILNSSEAHNYKMSSAQETFLAQSYLKTKYHVPAEVNRALNNAILKLEAQFPKTFVGICLVGGLSNGSYMLRKAELKNRKKTIFHKIFKPSVASDVDFYLLLDKAKPNDLKTMSQIVVQEFQSIGLPADGELNGRTPDSILDISKIDQYIAREDFDLLVLPFRNAKGHRIKEVQEKIVQAIKNKKNAATIWEKMQFHHDSTLAIYHGSFDPAFMNHVSEVWLPKKVEKFGLTSLKEWLKNSKKK